MNSAKTYDVIEAAEAQKRYCSERNCPMFAPDNGWCYNCGRNIYEPYTYRREPIKTFGISIEEAGSKLVTNCPHCGRTFVD